MKIYISYFYQIRNFNKYMIPLSTAMFDPKWYHEGMENSHLFWDKNGVINGLRCYQFIFNPKDYRGWCGEDCKIRLKRALPTQNEYVEDCTYLKLYRKMLDNIIWSELIQFFESVIVYVASHNKDMANIDKYNICLMVHEATDAVCSERSELIKWFKTQGVDLIEWNKEYITEVGDND